VAQLAKARAQIEWSKSRQRWNKTCSNSEISSAFSPTTKNWTLSCRS